MQESTQTITISLHCPSNEHEITFFIQILLSRSDINYYLDCEKNPFRHYTVNSFNIQKENQLTIQ